MDKRKRGNKEEASSTQMDIKSIKMELKSIQKDIENIGSYLNLAIFLFIVIYRYCLPYHGRPILTWKAKKGYGNRKVVSLGGKNMILGQVGGNRGNRSKRAPESRKPEDRVLMSTAGRFKNGLVT
ncbi:hypothetical protein Tco_0179761 [Tanacetum coccineum]